MAKKKNTVRPDGRISVQIYIGNVDGKRKYKTVYGKTQKEVDAKATDVKAAMRKGLDVAAEKDTFKDWADRWLNLKSTEVSHGRLENYKYNIAKFESIFNIPLVKLKTADFQQVIIDLSVENPTTKKPTSKATLLQTKSAALQVCRLAIENRVMDYNPVEAVKIPKVESTSFRRALTAEEQKWIIETPHRAQTAAMIMMFSGLRRGELIPLTWSDVDFKNATISVNKSIEFIDGKAIIKETGKTKSSIRTVDIPDILVDYLKKIKREVKNTVLVCPSAKGQLITEASWRRMWESYLTDLNLKYGDFETHLNVSRPKSKFHPEATPFLIPHFTAHWLRHTFATMLYFAGVDVLTAKEQLGHSDIQTTLNIYTHLDGKFKRKSMNKLNDFLRECKSDASQLNDQSL